MAVAALAPSISYAAPSDHAGVGAIETSNLTFERAAGSHALAAAAQRAR
jgi:hypothetical protein